MGSRIVEFDWAGHRLGGMDGWPDWMRVTVAEMLASRFPIVLWFGDELFLMYNDAYLSVLGESIRRRWALRAAWSGRRSGM